ncbi:TRC40/GET3/ArsA family transport-energizing ATPase [Halorubrum ezzemoulense]|jgi:arsenite-transporting ATPase|uniref:ATPase n=2 Tax=Halorubrum ezzemoulense TaxID=337243 RepID=A0A256JPK5_HALEZ|nr:MULTISPECIES: TRC40/GET3/ArsA family transport-energizing ATPase [Halorubrum]MDB2238715.1 TRC40/GET3/ArsA family transport-energizing ATPase [Halorubrum ezzemoulense]MDB2239768.1 TRC40/GET3/ArsA family transport-energizing ATPase [Halorubrum ezzemoulense]MDB2248023.1 TRC40/GET3/ArsA family transport-energizing ATPase [Halorubrum ezzemoulense]MDB2261256.1 TRC40/GET3/ArsA family transport-energizing ATPase [Halorubrum ezzemoulense]MDB2264925.1 TRC40/GET3/ArsA family transport-energizing ATPas
MEQFVFFGGKGGVGKTTVSCAYAHRCARDGLRTLVVSTDPAHSVSDVFDQRFGDEPESVADVDGLDAMEIDPEDEMQRHLTEIREALSEQVSAAMVSEINRQLEMSHGTPGAYESALFDAFVDVMRTESEPYDRVVFDTAPTGSTLRLLGLPEFLGDWIDRLLYKREQSIDLFEKAAIGDMEPRRLLEGDPVIERLNERKEFFEYAGETMRTDAAFFLVLNPDQLSVNETERAIEAFTERDLRVRGLVANKLTPSPDEGEQGRGARYLREKVETERERLAQVREGFDPPLVAEIESRTTEVRGDVLADVAASLDVEP